MENLQLDTDVTKIKLFLFVLVFLPNMKKIRKL